MNNFPKIFGLFRGQSLLVKGSFQLLNGGFYSISNIMEGLPYDIQLSFVG